MKHSLLFFLLLIVAIVTSIDVYWTAKNYNIMAEVEQNLVMKSIIIQFGVANAIFARCLSSFFAIMIVQAVFYAKRHKTAIVLASLLFIEQIILLWWLLT